MVKFTFEETIVFVPLHIYTSYSFLSSGFTLEKLFLSLKEKGYESAAITDFEVLYGVPEFFTLARKQHVLPLAGLDLYIHDMLVTFFAKDEIGYRQLIAITTEGQKTQAKELIFTEKNDHLVAVISPSQSHLFSKDPSEIAKTIHHYLGGITSIFIGIERYATTVERTIEPFRQFATKYNYPCVAFPHIRYPKASDAIVLDILEAIHQGSTLSMKEKNGDYYLPSLAEIKAWYTEDEISQTVVISNMLNFNFFIKRGQLLAFDPKQDANTLLRELTIEGLQERDIDFSNSEYLTRLDDELNIIETLGFSDYFLIVSDFIKYAKSQAIPVGPGRGSAPGSLVAYALKITEIDPLKHQLLFERFLNPSRKTMPDIDVDIADYDREKIIQYLKQKYGENRVAHIITYQTIQAKQAIRDIARVYQFSSTSVDLISQSITDSKLDLRGNYKKNPEFQKLFDEDLECAEIIKLAHKIEGFIRQSGVHPAGVIINNTPIDDVLPLVNQQGMNITQYESVFLEAQGFLKIDILGLRNLTIIQQCLFVLKQNQVTLNLSDISYDDPKVFQLLQSGLNMGIFQLESEGMKKAMMMIEPTKFDDIVSLIALYRPGPMSNIPTYAKRKKGLEPVTIFDPQLADILAPTYGIIIYQEQIMQIAQRMAGFTLSKADDFRRAISKKDLASMQELKDTFIRGSVSKGFKPDHAQSVFNHIIKFADYGFNKSHSVAYATITYQMAYLKAYYPLAFYQSILQFATSSDQKLMTYLDELRQLNVKILPPSISFPVIHFTVQGQALIAPLTLIKGISDNFVKTVKHVLNSGPFTDFYDAVTRLYPYKITIPQLTSLIDAGAFDHLHPSRATLRASLPNAIKNASIQATFIDESTGLIPPTNLPKMPMVQAEDMHSENVDKELTSLGFVLSLTILDHKKSYRGFPSLKPIKIAKEQTGNIVTGGIITSIRQVKTKAGQAMAFMTIFDETDTLDCVIFPKLFETIKDPLKKGFIILVSGSSDREKKGTLLVEQLQVIDQ
jgi:DNA polymerase III subunit alpha